MEDARLDEHGEVRDFGQRWDVNPQHLHAELPVAVPHGDGEHALVVLLVDGQLLMGSWQRRKTVGLEEQLVDAVILFNQSCTEQ